MPRMAAPSLCKYSYGICGASGSGSGNSPPDVLASMLGDVDDATFQNFALTDDAVIFFFGQVHLLGHPEGLLEVSVPRIELASVLA